MTIPSASDLFVVDSTGWVEYLGNGPKVDRFATYFESPVTLLLPSIIVYEIHKKISREQGSILAIEFLSQAYAFGDRLIPLTLELAVLASQTSAETGLPMADAIIYATAHHYKAQLITSDSHFANLPRVTLI
ncbi:MAG TPA: type II toxin-antitoxin system VapC family toxin [Verrucomicrobiae bacterium]|nr:type II toxin-antitoxin system VapC family toxin [Verrucomicrobiae bacterium]